MILCIIGVGKTQQHGPKVWEIVGEQQEILRITGISKKWINNDSQ
jgi:hypothetical protein